MDLGVPPPHPKNGKSWRTLIALPKEKRWGTEAEQISCSRWLLGCREKGFFLLAWAYFYWRWRNRFLPARCSLSRREADLLTDSLPAQTQRKVRIIFGLLDLSFSVWSKETVNPYSWKKRLSVHRRCFILSILFPCKHFFVFVRVKILGPTKRWSLLR